MTNPLPPLAVSLGDPSGIGPNIILNAWSQKQKLSLPDFFVVGDIACLERRAALLKLDCDFKTYALGDTISQNLPVLDIGLPVLADPGSPSVEDAQATITAIDKSVELVITKQASGMVTCPINKDILYQAGFEHPGHTEYLAYLAKQHTRQDTIPVMMIAGPKLRTIPVTIHIALSEVPASLTTELIVKTSRIAAHDLIQKFGIKNPRLAVSGLNPHSGENGNMGHEDMSIIKPAIEQLVKEGINAWGPLPADTMFHPAARTAYDVAICMYHDQALIPAKTLGFDDGVNVTLGLPFIRTSPDHGTAYDIAHTQKANPSSFIAALKMAHEMATAK